MARRAENGRLACQSNWGASSLEIWVLVRDHRRMLAWSDWFEKRRLDIELRRRLRHLEERPGVASPLSAWERLRQETLMEARNSLQTGPCIPWQVFSKLESGEQADLKQRFPRLVEDSLWQRDPLGPPSGERPAGWQDLMPWERKLSPFD
jgi:hypothetical protein